MKLKNIFSGIAALLIGAAVLTACSDDDYSSGKTPLLSDGSVVTGSSDVTATTATFHGSVTGLENMSGASYATGFKYGFSADALTETATAQSAGEFSATLDGLLTNQVIYYQAYVTLQGRLTYTGEVKSLITTDATVTTGEYSDVDFAEATMAGSISKYPSSATAGVVLATVDDEETVRAGLRVEGELADNFIATQKGLLPNTTYYYAAYLDLGPGVIFGEVKSFTTDEKTYDADEDFVDLGLSVKWAKCNVGAKNPTDFGGYFGFGDVTGTQTSIDPADYASEDTYKTLNDVAYHATGGIATLPTADLFEELFRLCKTEWIEQDGVAGFRVTGKNGNSIFLPAAGKRIESTVSENGTQGYYLTGSINPSNTEFAINYEFSSSMNSRATRAVYEALAVRPVSVARNVAFDKTLLYQKWYLDNGQDGKQHVFEGPFTQWGVHDNWGTISNNEPNLYENIHWEMGTDNGWIGYTYGKDYGYMEFKEDGTMIVARPNADGDLVETTGTYTIDEATKTITTNIDVLAADTWLSTKSGTLNILTLTADGLQIALPADATYAYSLNYYSEKKRKDDAKVSVNLLAVDGNWNGTWGSTLATIAPEELNGTHTVTYNGALASAMVNTLDLTGLDGRWPNMMVRIDDIKMDGQSIQFDANKFFYGDIENNGNFRVELFNIWGKGATDGLVRESPLSTLTNVGSEPAFSCQETCEITFTVVTDALNKAFTPNLITINPGWGGTWGFNQGATFNISLVDNKYAISNPTFDITYTSGDHADGSIMTFIEIADLFGAFPQTHATLNSLALDGNNVRFDKTGVLDTSEGGKYRLELWNMYGATSSAGCAFGTATAGGVIEELGFSTSMKVNFTINSLFNNPFSAQQ